MKDNDKAMNPVIITGATGSMGSVAARHLAQEDVPVILACRNIGRGEQLRRSILAEFPSAELELLQLDLETAAGVRDFADALSGRPLGGLFNNAGTICRHFGTTSEGIEKTMAVNCLMPVFLTQLLTPQFDSGAHIVNMVSLSLKFYSPKVFAEECRSGIRFDNAHSFSQIGSYARSKLAFLYLTVALARHNPSLVFNVADPGIVDSKIIRLDRWFDPLTDVLFRPFVNTPQKGVRPALNALYGTDSLRYYVGSGSRPIPAKYLRSPFPDLLWKEVSACFLNH